MNYSVQNQENPTNVVFLKINLPSSKSEANRLLIIQALSGHKDFVINNLSTARDTVTLKKLLAQTKTLSSYNVLDAGTAMRFLTAYLATTTQAPVLLTGTDRMQKRPIGTLVDALCSIGGNISYEREQGYPPLKINSLATQTNNQISIKGNISSQYISALLMVAPYLPKGLIINIVEPIYSQPYIDMTVSLMQQAGIMIKKSGHTYSITHQSYKPFTFDVESDWSGASYWFSFIALSRVGKQLYLKGLRKESFQGDQAIVGIMKKLGVRTVYDEKGILLEKIADKDPRKLSIDFREFPDLAQTIVVCCAALRINLEMTGLESLRIKETDRIAALDQELTQFNCRLKESSAGAWELASDGFRFPKIATINTYDDHRMAMSFMPLSLIGSLTIMDIEVVNKSYPTFWTDCSLAGLQLLEQ
ncbi:MAG: 3-phosphoshikimate 1-carboxyvinyltransferase [Marivirga sp.]